MIDVKELEKRWLRYTIKKYLPYGLLTVSSIIIVIISYTLLHNKVAALLPNKQNTHSTLVENKQIQPKTSIPKTTIKQPIATPKTTISQSQIAQIEQKPQITKPQPTQKLLKPIMPHIQTTTQTQKLQPSLEFLKKLKENAVYPIIPPSQPLVTTQPKKPQPQITTQPTKKILKQQTNLQQTNTFVKENDDLMQTPKPKIKIVAKKTSAKELREIALRFKRTNNPVLGVFLAKEYYKRKDYKKAYVYSLMTNKIDSTIEDSWLIFAKSLVKLDRRDKAIKILKIYIDTSHSKKAQLLLDNIKTGKFR